MERAYAVLADRGAGRGSIAMLAAQLGRLTSSSGSRPGEALAPTERALEIAEALELPEVFAQALNTKARSPLWGRGAASRKARSCSRHERSRFALEHDLVEVAGRSYNNYGAILEEADRSMRSHLNLLPVRRPSMPGASATACSSAERGREPVLAAFCGSANGTKRSGLAAELEPRIRIGGRTRLPWPILLILMERGDSLRRRGRSSANRVGARNGRPSSFARGTWSLESLILRREGRPREALATLRGGPRRFGQRPSERRSVARRA